MGHHFPTLPPPRPQLTRDLLGSDRDLITGESNNDPGGTMGVVTAWILQLTCVRIIEGIVEG